MVLQGNIERRTLPTLPAGATLKLFIGHRAIALLKLATNLRTRERVVFSSDHLGQNQVVFSHPFQWRRG
jgi:hypothetical protein